MKESEDDEAIFHFIKFPFYLSPTVSVSVLSVVSVVSVFLFLGFVFVCEVLIL